jgi:hypothetical protein
MSLSLSDNMRIHQDIKRALVTISANADNAGFCRMEDWKWLRMETGALIASESNFV